MQFVYIFSVIVVALAGYIIGYAAGRKEALELITKTLTVRIKKDENKEK